jgi:hypothetical protein
MKKSTRHSKITGDFAEQLVLYWLSKHGYECTYVDHTGIDIIAASGTKRLGISVKSRSRNEGQESDSVLLKEFEKAKSACFVFGCEPWVAVVVDGAGVIRCYLLSLAKLDQISSSARSKRWPMSPAAIEQYANDSEIMRFELHLQNEVWS